MVERLVILMSTLLIGFNVFAQDRCDDLSSAAQRNSIRFESADSGYDVTGKGRLYFYSAPVETCKINNLFIVPGDSVNAYLDFDGYYYVLYFSKSGEQVEGWVKSSRLKENGTGNGPKN